ncbi:MAG TPA: type II CAAX endopeptidase family protein [Conexibacter sp.]|jgi:membrane protease YdiL (CAAX protease family)|nr:type II CAAX endopeptidase family protein [Conexibacter sp.]
MSSVPSYGSWLPPAVEPPGGPPPSGPTGAGDDGGARGWAPWTAGLALILAFMFAIVGAIVVGVIGAIFGASFTDPPPAVNIAATVVQDGAFIGAALAFAARAGHVVPAQFGFVRTRLLPALGWMAGAYVAYIALGAVWAQIVDTHAENKLPDSLGADESTAALVAVCVVVTVIAPIAEETFFRGYFFGALRNWRGPWPAALITGLVFGGIHAGSADAVFLVPLAILGFMLCIVRWKTGSLLPCIALHAMNNALAFGITERWSGGATLLLLIGAVSVTMLACAALVPRGSGEPDARLLI